MTHSELNTDIHYFIPLRPCHRYGFVNMVCDSDTPHYVECVLKPYTFNGFKYKLIAVPLDPNYAQETFYTSDFIGDIKHGRVIPKDTETKHVVTKIMYEAITVLAGLVHTYEEVED